METFIPFSVQMLVDAALIVHEIWTDFTTFHIQDATWQKSGSVFLNKCILNSEKRAEDDEKKLIFT